MTTTMLKRMRASFTAFCYSWKAALLILLLALAARTVHLTADPPKDLCWSLGVFFDEGVYNHNARNQLLFGEWRLDEWNDFYYSAVSTWVKYEVMRVIGVGAGSAAHSPDAVVTDLTQVHVAPDGDGFLLTIG